MVLCSLTSVSLLVPVIVSSISATRSRMLGWCGERRKIPETRFAVGPGSASWTSLIRVVRPPGRRTGVVSHRLGVGRWTPAEVAAVLVVAAVELDVVEDDPDVGGVELGKGGQAGQEVGLVVGAQHSCYGWSLLHEAAVSTTVTSLSLVTFTHLEGSRGSRVTSRQHAERGAKSSHRDQVPHTPHPWTLTAS